MEILMIAAAVAAVALLAFLGAKLRKSERANRELMAANAKVRAELHERVERIGRLESLNSKLEENVRKLQGQIELGRKEPAKAKGGK